MKNQRGYTITELLIVLWFIACATLAVGLVGTIIWAIIKLVQHFL